MVACPQSSRRRGAGGVAQGLAVTLGEQVSKPGVAYCSGLWGLLHLHGDGCDGALRQNGPQVVIFVILVDVVYALDALKVLEPGGHVLTVERPDGALESLNEGDCRWRSLVVRVEASSSLVLGVNVPLLESVVHFAIVRQSFLRLNYRTGSVGPCEDCLWKRSFVSVSWCCVSATWCFGSWESMGCRSGFGERRSDAGLGSRFFDYVGSQVFRISLPHAKLHLVYEHLTAGWSFSGLARSLQVGVTTVGEWVRVL